MSAVTDPGERTFLYAIAVSLVLHALLLFAVPGLKEGKRAAEPPGALVARIAEPPSAPAPAPAPKEPVARPLEPPKPRVEPPPKPTPVLTPSPIAERAAEPAPAPPPSAEPAAPAASAAGPVAKTEAQPGPADPDSGSLRDYEGRLSFFAARYKVYPRVAVDNAWEGNVEVMMVIGANGVLRSISVRTSSGYQVLDQQAMEMFRRAKPLVPIPPALAGREFTVTRWVSFGLKEGG